MSDRQRGSGYGRDNRKRQYSQDQPGPSREGSSREGPLHEGWTRPPGSSIMDQPGGSTPALQEQNVSHSMMRHQAYDMGGSPAAGSSTAGSVAGSSVAGSSVGRSFAPKSGDDNGRRSSESSSLGRGNIRNRPMRNPELFETRPKNLLSKQGRDGKPIQLQANYFKMVTTTDWCLYKYRVDFAPEEERTIARKGLLKVHKPTLGAYIFDGTVLYTSHRLPQPLELFSKRKSDDADIQIIIRLVGDMARGDEHYLQFFNIIMRKCLEHLKLQLVGRNYFDAHNQVEVRQYKLELWPGYETSIRQLERDILMCAEITHKVMRQQTILDILNECYQQYGQDYQTKFSARVIGLTVLTDYNNHTYRIDDVDFDVSPKSTFSCKGTELSYMDYYYNKYQIPIRQSTQPMLLSRSKARDRKAGISELVYLVPELCRATGLNDDMRSDRTMMRELANHTRVNPSGRIQRLLSFNRRLQSEPKVVQELAEWNLRLDTKLVNIPARRFETEKIVFGNRTQLEAGTEADWTRLIRNNRMYMTTKLQSWCIIVPHRMASDAQRFVSLLRNSVQQMQFPISDPQNIVINDDRSNSYTCAIENAMSRNNFQLIMCIVPNNRADRYSAIKKKCCIDRPVPNQCMLGKNLNGKGAASIATKVAVQMNCKIGGAPWTVVIPLKGLMIVGYDVCHDPNVKNRDYGAMVASLDQGHSRYFSAVSAHTNGEELSNSLGVNICKALHKFRDENKALPSRIVIYRDGVSEGQIPFVYEHEVENVKNKLAKLYGDPELVKMAYIIVTKRLNTRLFYNENNPPPGTIVDDIITNPIKYDFFIVSQHIRQGTVSPTGYSVIFDSVNLDATKIQRLTYKLTHMYFNWSGTIRVPAPCQFAHKLAFLVSQAIHSNPSDHLETLLYFL